MVENHFCVNPTRELLAKVMESGKIKDVVRIVVERKDVVYMLKPDCVNIS